MIGRGTRLCKDLLGPGLDKTTFRIFDHWSNFEYFDQARPEVQPVQPKSLLHKLFEARIELAEAALQQGNIEAFEIAKKLIESQVNTLPQDAVSVREKWREVQTAANPDALQQFSDATVAALRRDVAPLMQWIDIAGSRDCYELDLLLARTETELVRGSMRVADLQAVLIDRVSELKMNLNPVKARIDAINQARSAQFWQLATVPALETIRTELRGIMHYRQWVLQERQTAHHRHRRRTRWHSDRRSPRSIFRQCHGCLHSARAFGPAPIVRARPNPAKNPPRRTGYQE